MTVTLENGLDDDIVLKPGETLRVRIEEDQSKVLVGRRKVLTIVDIGVRGTGEDAGPRGKHCQRCGEFNDTNLDKCESCEEDITDAPVI